MLIFGLIVTLVPAISFFLLTKTWPSMKRWVRIALSALTMPLLLLVRMLYGFWWINSDHCTTVDICDSGGMLAMAAGMLFAMLISAGIGFVVAFSLDHLRRSK